MELRHLHVDQVGAGRECHGDAIAGVLPRVGRDFPAPTHSAGCQGNRSSLEEYEAAVLSPVPKRATDPLAILEQRLGGALHGDVHALVNRMVVSSANHFAGSAVL